MSNFRRSQLLKAYEELEKALIERRFRDTKTIVARIQILHKWRKSV